MDFMTETTLLAFIIILVILMILIGAGIALLVGAAGLHFYLVTFIIAFGFWIIFSLGYFIWS